MKVLFILEAGIPEYRNFLFEKLAKESEIKDFMVIHNGRIYNGSGNYKSKKLKFYGSSKFGFYVGLFKYIRRYDVVVSSYNLRIVSCWLPAIFKRKWIFWGKGLGGNESLLIKLLRKLTAEKCAKLLVYNNSKKNELIDVLNILPSKIVAYNNTIHISNSENLEKVTKEYFLYFGRIQERKGVLDLIKAYNIYYKENEGVNVFKLRIVGNGDFGESLVKEVNKLQLGDVVEFFPGVYTDEDIKIHFSKAIAYVSPYNVGLAIVNSFAYGVPVVTIKSPQVGPEFSYLNTSNSLILNDISELSSAFNRFDRRNSPVKGDTVFKFYQENLGSNIMYNHFFSTIKTTYCNE